MLAHGEHLGGEDAGGAVQGGEGLVELGHVPADGRLALHHINVVAAVGDFQSRLDAGDAPADHEDVGVDLDRDGLQGLVKDDLAHGPGDQRPWPWRWR